MPSMAILGFHNRILLYLDLVDSYEKTKAFFIDSFPGAEWIGVVKLRLSVSVAADIRNGASPLRHALVIP